MSAVLDAVPAAVFIAHDPACKRISGNRAASEMLRVPAGPIDRLGPQFGDQLLEIVAVPLRESFRKVDSVSRLGDEESCGF